MGYDVKCYELAEFFLKDGGWTHSEDIHRLAQVIQDAIEDYIAELENELARGNAPDHL